MRRQRAAFRPFNPSTTHAALSSAPAGLVCVLGQCPRSVSGGDGPLPTGSGRSSRRASSPAWRDSERSHGNHIRRANANGHVADTGRRHEANDDRGTAQGDWPPTCGTIPITIVQTCMSKIRAAGGIVYAPLNRRKNRLRIVRVTLVALYGKKRTRATLMVSTCENYSPTDSSWPKAFICTILLLQKAALWLLVFFVHFGKSMDDS